MIADVVVVSFESARHLAECLTPLVQPVTVIDNASTDGSAAAAAHHGATVIRNPTNRGFAAAANQGAARTAGEVILFLNPDAVCTQASIDVLAQALDDDDTLAIVGAELTRPSGEVERSWWPYPSPGQTWIEALALHRLLPARFGAPVRGFVVGACIAVRRSAFEQLGGFDEAFWLYGEEADLCLRAELAGWGVLSVPRATAVHIGGASGAWARASTFEHFHLGTERFIRKHHGPPWLLVHRLGLLFGSAIRLPFLAISAGPEPDPRFKIRFEIARRLVRQLLTQPTELPR